MYGPNHRPGEKCDRRDSEGRCQCVGFCEMTGADCRFVPPELDPVSALALQLFLECHTADQYQYAGMSAIRRGIPIERVQKYAEILGIDLHEIIAKKHAACVGVIVELDAARSSKTT